MSDLVMASLIGGTTATADSQAFFAVSLMFYLLGMEMLLADIPSLKPLIRFTYHLDMY